MSRHQP